VRIFKNTKSSIYTLNSHYDGVIDKLILPIFIFHTSFSISYSSNFRYITPFTGVFFPIFDQISQLSMFTRRALLKTQSIPLN